MNTVINKHRDIIKAAVDTYGHDAQLKQLFEEMAELQVVLLHQQRGRADRAQVVSEIADVLIMLEQLQDMLEITDAELGRAIRLKLTRLDKRLNGKESA